MQTDFNPLLFGLTPYIPLSSKRGGLNQLYFKPLPPGGGVGERSIIIKDLGNKPNYLSRKLVISAVFPKPKE
jgi:hypothetical protein